MDERFTKSEPTTGEINDWISTQTIVRMLRKIQNSAQVVLDSGFGTRDGECNMVYRDRRDNMKLAADRLESQERKNEWYNDLLDMSVNTSNDLEDQIKSQEQTIAALTARAEQAERERDAAIKFIRTSDWCAGCENMKNLHCDFMKECANPRDLYKLRGLPQDGEGK